MLGILLNLFVAGSGAEGFNDFFAEIGFPIEEIIKGAGGVFMKIFKKRLFDCFWYRRGDWYLSDAFGPLQNIVPSWSYGWSKVGAYIACAIFNRMPCKTILKIYLFLQF